MRTSSSPSGGGFNATVKAKGMDIGYYQFKIILYHNFLQLHVES